MQYQCSQLAMLTKSIVHYWKQGWMTSNYQISTSHVSPGASLLYSNNTLPRWLSAGWKGSAWLGNEPWTANKGRWGAFYHWSRWRHYTSYKKYQLPLVGWHHRWCYLVTIIITHTHTHTHTTSLYIKKEKVFHAISATLPVCCYM